ncbi:sugar-binding transcriptional regulator [Naasia lichenicola]|nr:sugar-binding transcriptional regulator [Naasia lichenicola]
MLNEPSAVASRLSPDRMSLLVKIARMYHEQGVRQPEIADRLHISQSRVSRFLKEAVALGIVRTVVVPPPGVHPDVEDSVRDGYGLSDVVIAHTSDTDETSLLSALGSAGAAYLETTLTGSERIGLSSWSATLIATVDAMTPRNARTAAQVIQLLGGVGDPRVQVQANRLADRLAVVTGADPVFFPAPGFVRTQAARDAILDDPSIQAITEQWSELSMVLVGIGSMQPSTLLRDSGNAVPPDMLEELRGGGAVGDVCLRFFDADGATVSSDLNDRVLGISVEQLKAVPRRVGIAGGPRKYEAIRAALRGGWVDVLITDLATAEHLAADL